MKYLFMLLMAISINVSATPMYLTNSDTGFETFYLDDLGGSATNSLFEIKLESAGYANDNTFGIYQIDSGNAIGTLGTSVNFLELFSGTDDVGYAAKLSWDTTTDVLSLQKSSDGIVYNAVAIALGLTINHNDFGFYLDTPDGVWFSETKYNSDGVDHMVAFNAGDVDSWALAWEDLAGGGDEDYNDFVLLADDILPVKSVPEPGILALMGFGLVGLGIAGSKREERKMSKLRKS